MGRKDVERVLVVEGEVAVADAHLRSLGVQPLGVERVRSELEAFRRLSCIPTIETVVIDAAFGGGDAVDKVARFARQVIPEVVLFTIDSRSLAAPDESVAG
jgi:hypothetical protein